MRALRHVKLNFSIDKGENSRTTGFGTWGMRQRKITRVISDETGSSRRWPAESAPALRRLLVVLDLRQFPELEPVPLPSALPRSFRAYLPSFHPACQECTGLIRECLAQSQMRRSYHSRPPHRTAGGSTHSSENGSAAHRCLASRRGLVNFRCLSIARRNARAGCIKSTIVKSIPIGRCISFTRMSHSGCRPLRRSETRGKRFRRDRGDSVRHSHAAL
jgi:hypothetical protein